MRSGDRAGSPKVPDTTSTTTMPITTVAPSTPTLSTTHAPYTTAVPATTAAPTSTAASATPTTVAPSAPTLSTSTAPYTTAVPATTATTATTAASGTITTTAQTTIPITYAPNHENLVSDSVEDVLEEDDSEEMAEDVKIITIDSKPSDSSAEEKTLMDDVSLVDEEEIG